MECLASTLQSRPLSGLTGVISVRTESWSSKDGVVMRSHKTQALGGPSVSQLYPTVSNNSSTVSLLLLSVCLSVCLSNVSRPLTWSYQICSSWSNLSSGCPRVIHSSFITPTGRHIQIYSEVK